MGATIRKYFQLKKFQIHMREASTVRVYPGSKNSWSRYEQLAGSQYASTKRAEKEILSCVRGYHMYKKIGRQRLLESFDTL